MERSSFMTFSFILLVMEVAIHDLPNLVLSFRMCWMACLSICCSSCVVPPKEQNSLLVDFRDGVGLTLEVGPVRGVFMVLS